jgi:hypothetical protein
MTMFRLSDSQKEEIEDYVENDMDADTMVQLLGNELIQEMIVGYVPEKHWLPLLTERYMEKLGEEWADGILDAERVENDLYL